jgi:hypothetical protein
MNVPKCPFLKDAEGAGKFALDVLRRYGRKSDTFDPAIYWAARSAVHWARMHLARQKDDIRA